MGGVPKVCFGVADVAGRKLFIVPVVLSASARAGSPHREFNKYLGAPKTQPDVQLRCGSGLIEIKQILSATSRETLFSGTVCL